MRAVGQPSSGRWADSEEGKTWPPLPVRSELQCTECDDGSALDIHLE